MSKRTESMGHIIQRALSPLLLEYEPQYGIITLTHVEVEVDLKKAKIILSSEKYTRQLCGVLQKKASFFQREIQQQLPDRRGLKLFFFPDTGQIHAKNIDHLL